MTLRTFKLLYWLIFTLGLIPLYYGLMTRSFILILITIASTFLLFAFSILFERDNSKTELKYLISRYFYFTVVIIEIILKIVFK